VKLWKGKRTYTGFDKQASGRRAGTQKLIDYVLFLNGGKIRNLGSFMVRDMRGKAGKPSVHSTGRAIDFGYTNREDGLALADFFVRNWEAFGVELIVDYYPTPHGRGWNVTRLAWQDYKKPTVSGAPYGRWLHVEISNEVADNAAYIDFVFALLLADTRGHDPSS